MEQLTYRVTGMHCGACTRSIEEEVSRVPGVASVQAELGSKLVTVRGEGLADRAVRAAIDEAGYEAEAA